MVHAQDASLSSTASTSSASCAADLVLGIADGWMKADGEAIYKATDLRVGLFQEKRRLRFYRATLARYSKIEKRKGRNACGGWLSRVMGVVSSIGNRCRKRCTSLAARRRSRALSLLQRICRSMAFTVPGPWAAPSARSDRRWSIAAPCASMSARRRLEPCRHGAGHCRCRARRGS